MSRIVRGLVVPLLAVAILGIGGCSSKAPKMVKVSGTVKFRDGTALPVPERAQGGSATIRFEPVDMEGGPEDANRPRKAAAAAIKPDGSYEVTTVKPGDGVIPGRYKVAVTVMGKYADPSSSLIPQRYGNPETSGFGVIEIDKSRSDLEFLLDKQ